MSDSVWTFPADDELRKKPAILYGLEMLWWWMSWPYRSIDRFIWVQRCIRGYRKAKSPDSPGGINTLWRRKEDVKDVIWLRRICDLPPSRLA